MTKSEFLKTVDSEFTAREVALISFNILYNSRHVEYYMKYKMGHYRWCIKYLKKYRYLLVLKHVPNEHKEDAESMVGQMPEENRMNVNKHSKSQFRIADIPDEQLIEEVKTGIRSGCASPMTKKEMDEVIGLMTKKGFYVLRTGETTFTTTQKGMDLHNELVGEYVMRKMSLGLEL